MVDLLTIDEVAAELGIDTELARNWCEKGHIDCARPSEGEILVARRELEALTEGIDPANRKQDRVELFSRVSEDEPEPDSQVRPLDRSIYAKFTTTFTRPLPDQQRENDVTYYLDRYAMVAHRMSELLDPSSTPEDRTIEQISKDTAELLKPLRGTDPEIGTPSLRTVLEEFDALLEGRSDDASYEIRTTVVQADPDEGTSPRLRTTLLISDVRDGTAVAIPSDPGQRSFPVYDRYLSEWKSDLRSLVAELDSGSTLTCGFVPANSDEYRLEFRAAALDPAESG